METPACRACKGPTLPDLIAEATGSWGPITVWLRKVPGYRCQLCRAVTLPSTRGDEFPAAITLALVNGAEIPTARRRGLLRRQTVCVKCGEPLDKAELAPHRFTIPIRIEEHPPFEAEMELPGWTCQPCNTCQATPESLMEEIIEAAGVVFDNAGVSH